MFNLSIRLDVLAFFSNSFAYLNLFCSKLTTSVDLSNTKKSYKFESVFKELIGLVVYVISFCLV